MRSRPGAANKEDRNPSPPVLSRQAFSRDGKTGSCLFAARQLKRSSGRLANQAFPSCFSRRGRRAETRPGAQGCGARGAAWACNSGPACVLSHAQRGYLAVASGCKSLFSSSLPHPGTLITVVDNFRQLHQTNAPKKRRCATSLLSQPLDRVARFTPFNTANMPGVRKLSSQCLLSQS